MAQGHDWSKPPFHEGVYRATFWKPFLVVSGLGFSMYFVALGALRGFSFAFGSWIATILVLAGLAALTGLIVAHYGTTLCPVRLTRESIIGMNAYGLKQTIRLEAIERVTRPWYGLGIYWVIYSKDSPLRIWVPTCLANPNEFLSALTQLVAEDHPLRKAVADDLAR